MGFEFKALNISELICITPDIYGDNRGYFSEIYKLSDYAQNGINKPFVQVNHSKSGKGTLRGLHYQIDPMAQGKLITVVEGSIFDVGVDLRKGSPTFGQWAGVTLDADSKKMLYMPEGFAHGFCVLSESAQVIYYCTEVYSPEHERGILWNDPVLGIKWPVKDPLLSERDSQMPRLREVETSFEYGKA